MICCFVTAHFHLPPPPRVLVLHWRFFADDPQARCRRQSRLLSALSAPKSSGLRYTGRAFLLNHGRSMRAAFLDTLNACKAERSGTNSRHPSFRERRLCILGSSEGGSAPRGPCYINLLQSHNSDLKIRWEEEEEEELMAPQGFHCLR